MELIGSLATQLDGSAHELDVSDPRSIAAVVGEAAEALGGIDAVVFTSAAITLARVDELDASTWLHGFMVNAIGPSLVLRAALPYLSKAAVAVIASSTAVGQPSAGTAHYCASKAALDEILRCWRCEHPDLRIIRVAVGPTEGTEILRGVDRDLLAEFGDTWARHGQIPDAMSSAADVANILVALIAAALKSPTAVTEVVHLAAIAKT
jgi:NAD(P)-dependent dehydrogenase (short-subunit alcohol dehydrogenase family)